MLEAVSGIEAGDFQCSAIFPDGEREDERNTLFLGVPRRIEGFSRPGA